MKFGSYDSDDERRKKERTNAAPTPAPKPGFGPGRGGGGRDELSPAQATAKTQELAAHTLPKERAKRPEAKGDHDRQQVAASKEADAAKPEAKDGPGKTNAAHKEQQKTLHPMHQRMNERIRAHKTDEGRSPGHVALNNRIRNPELRDAARKSNAQDLKQAASQSRENRAVRDQQQAAQADEQKKAHHR